MFSRALFLALFFSPLAHSAWTISEMTCHDTDCIAGAVNMGFTFDNGAGLKTHCGLTASPWNVPGDLRTCDDHSIQWKIIEGNRFGGCANFNIQIRADTMQQKDVLINEATDTNYQCSQPVSPPCGDNLCEPCQNTFCSTLTATVEPDDISHQCAFHVTQYQKPDPSKDSYKFDVIIKDANGNEIGSVYGAVATGPIEVKSSLPLPLIVTAGNVDADAVLFSYGDQNWGSNDQPHHCNFGKYDSGNRDGDCGFAC